MILEVPLKDIYKENELMGKLLRDKMVLSNSMVYILEEYFPDLSLLHSDNVMLLEDSCGARYKVLSSSSGKFNITQSCTKGIGRDKSFGDWREFTSKHNIGYLLLVNTRKDTLRVKIVSSELEGNYEF